MIRILALFALMTATASSAAATVQVCDGALVDPARADRRIPVRIRIPTGPGPHPVVLFSHGLGGSVDAGTLWAKAWADSGIAVIHLQHPGSDASLWKGLKGAQALQALKAGMGAGPFLARIADAKLALDSIGSRLQIGTCAFDRLDPGRIGIAGHSLGAQTVQALAGQQFRTSGGLVSVADPRIRAAIAFSPAPAAAEPDESAFGAITIPFLSITGSNDTVPITNVTPEDRERPFRAMLPGDKYLLVLDGADHMVFSGGEPRRPATANDARIEAIADEATRSFWAAYLASGANSVPLQPPSLLGKKDRWQHR